MTPPRPRTVVRVGFVGVACSLVGLLLAGALAAPASFLPGLTEVAEGADVGQQSVAYWTWMSTELWKIPLTVPAVVSGAVALPSRLGGAGGSLTLNAATAGDASVRWQFLESTTAPHSTELELRFTVGLAGGAVTFRSYLETQTAAPTGALTFFLFWDAGTVAPTGITVESMQVSVLVCASIGHCP